MPIVIRHATLSEKTQSAIAGIISKNEWNAVHTLVEPILEGDIQFSPTGHSHNGTDSKVAARVVAVQDSLGTTNYRVASSNPTINEVPILASDGYLNIKRSGTLQYAGLRIYDTNGTTIKGYLRYDFTGTSINIRNNVGTNYIGVNDSGQILLSAKTGSSIINSTNTVTLKSQNTGPFTWPSYDDISVTFQNISSSEKGKVFYRDTTDTTQAGVYLYNSTSTCNIVAKDNGNVVLQSATVSGKSYYLKTGESVAATKEIARKEDLYGLIIRGYTLQQSFTTPGTGSWVVPANVYRILVHLQGGGGGGGGISGYYAGGAGGGGEGAFLAVLMDVVPGESLVYAVGAGGDGGPVYTGVGGTGGDSKIGSGNDGNYRFYAGGGAGGVGGVWYTGGYGGAGGTAGLYANARPTTGGAGGYGQAGNSGAQGGTGFSYYDTGLLGPWKTDDVQNYDQPFFVLTTLVGRAGGNGANKIHPTVGGGGGGAGIGGGQGSGYNYVSTAGTNGYGSGGGGGSHYGGPGSAGGSGYVKIYYYTL